MKKILLSLILGLGLISTSSQAVNFQDLNNLTARHPVITTLTAFSGLSYILYKSYFGTPHRIQKIEKDHDDECRRLNRLKTLSRNLPGLAKGKAKIESMSVSIVPSLVLFCYLAAK
jgi:hypothetical protein